MITTIPQLYTPIFLTLTLQILCLNFNKKQKDTLIKYYWLSKSSSGVLNKGKRKNGKEKTHSYGRKKTAIKTSILTLELNELLELNSPKLLCKKKKQ